MSFQGPKTSRISRANTLNSQPPTGLRSFASTAAAAAAANANSSSFASSTHLAMVELKQKILTSLSKLADRDTYQIAVSDLESTIETISVDAIPMLLNCLFDSSNDPKLAVKKDSIRLLAYVCTSREDSTFNHLTKIISQISRRLKDSDSGVKDACRDAIGALSTQYLKNEGVVGLFAKPLFEAMGEQNKAVQSGAALCMAKMIDCAPEPPVAAFQKMCPRICKLLNNPNFLARAALLPVISSLSQVGAIAPQSFDSLLHVMQECLGSPDWATRRAAAEALSALALHSSNLITESAASTITVLEDCRFDKVKPVRDSILEALGLWKKIFGNGDGGPDDEKSVSQEEGGNIEPNETSEKNEKKSQNPGEKKDSSNGSSPTGPDSEAKEGNISDKAVVILKKKGHALTDKEINPEFFHRLETQSSVEVVVPRNHNFSNSNNEDSGTNVGDSRGKFRSIERGISSFQSKRDDDLGKDWRQRASSNESSQREVISDQVASAKPDPQSEGSVSSSKGNWMAIQRQLLQLERQQSHLMSMLQDFMGGSHDSMITLENRVRGLERVVEDMARDLSISSGRRGNSFAMGHEGSNSRFMGKYNGFSDYGNGKFGRGSEGRIPLGDRYGQSEGTGPSMRGRNIPWRSDGSEAWDFPSYGGSSRNGQIGSKKVMSKSDHDGDNVGGRRAWEKRTGGAIRHGEGPSARSVWQASKDEATLEAIRGAGEDGGSSQAGARVAVRELVAEAMEDGNVGRERDPVWDSWTNAMDALQVGDIDTAYAEVLSTEDDLLLVKLMDRSGPVIDQLSSEVATEVLNGVVQFLLEQNLFGICLCWIQQLFEIVLEHGPNAVELPLELKKELLFNLHETYSDIDPPEDWEGASPEQLLVQLASAWEINLQQFEK